MPAQTINSAALHYTDEGHGQAIVLLHGFPLDSRMWAAQIDAFFPTHRVIAPDFRGFGRSPAAGSFTIESLADDIHALAQNLAITPFILAGLSMGGYVALAYA